MVFEEAEAALVDAVRSVLPWNWTGVDLVFDFGDGSFSHSGSVSRMLRASVPFSEIKSGAAFSRAAFDLRKASLKAQDEPVLAMKLAWKRGSAPCITYTREAREVASIRDVPRDLHGQLPLFMFKRALPAKLLMELRPREVVPAIQTYVAANPDIQISQRLQELVAINGWLACVCRGGSDSYFLDGPFISERAAVEAILLIRSGLLSQGEQELASIFDQSLAVYAPESPAAMQVCKTVNLAPHDKRPSDNDAEVNRITRLVQSQDLAWQERIGRLVQEHPLDYVTA